MSSKSKSQLRTENSTNFPNNNSQFITPEKLRGFNNDIIDSLVVSSDTGSYVTTSSFDNGTRNLTFTKADGSTYVNNIPGGGGGSTDTGSLLTTASVADATITFTKGDASQFSIEVNNVSASIQAEDLVITVKNVSGVTLPAGTAVKATGVVGENITIVSASADNPSFMPAIGVLNQQLTNNSTGECYIAGRLENINTSNLVAGAAVYVNNNGGLTATKPTGSELIQNIGIAAKINGTEGELVIQGSGRSNDLPNITEGYLWVGDSNGVPEAISTGSFVKEAETGSFARTNVANTFTAGPQTASGSNGYFKSQLEIPRSGFTQKAIWDGNGQNLSVAGNGDYNIYQGTLSFFSGYGRWYDGSWYEEAYDSGFTYGAERLFNGGGHKFTVYSSGSSPAQYGDIRLQDDYDGTTSILMDSQRIAIGTSGNAAYRAVDGILIGSTNGPITLKGDTTLESGRTLTVEGDTVFSGSVTLADGISTNIARTDTANTFTGGIQLASGSNNVFTSQPEYPTAGAAVQKVLVNLNNQAADVDGNGPYNVFQSTISHFDGYGRWYDGSLYNEALLSSFEGAEEIFNGGGWKAAVAASGSGYSRAAQLYIQDDFDQSTSINAEAQQINIGTLTSGLYQARDGINIGSTNGQIYLKGNVNVTAPISSSTYVSASAFIGDGSQLSGVAGGIFIQTGSFYSTSNNLQVTGSFNVKGGIGGSNVDLTIASQTASLDLRNSNTFTLQLVNATDTHLNVSSFSGEGQSINVLVKQPIGGGQSGSISFSSDFKFGQGYEFIPTPLNGVEDMLSFTRFGNYLYGTYINNFS